MALIGRLAHFLLAPSLATVDGWLKAKAGKQEASLAVNENQVSNTGNKRIIKKTEIDNKHLG